MGKKGKVVSAVQFWAEGYDKPPVSDDHTMHTLEELLDFAGAFQMIMDERIAVVEWAKASLLEVTVDLSHLQKRLRTN